MMIPTNSRWNAVFFLAVIVWLFVLFPLRALDLVINHRIDDETFRAVLQYVGGAGGVITMVLQGLNLWNNSP
jgi:cytochrome bd-type quinol oxidase subunit 2